MNQIIYPRPNSREYTTLAEFFSQPYYPEAELLHPRIVVRQCIMTKELRVDVYGCNTGLPITFTNGGTNDERAKWFRDVIVDDTYWSPLRVRFLGSNLELRS